MFGWIKKIFCKEKKPPVATDNKCISDEERDREILELILLEDDICSKHHG